MASNIQPVLQMRSPGRSIIVLTIVWCLALTPLVAVADDATTAEFAQQAYLKASNTGSVDNFGSAVAISGDTLVVGARAEDSSTSGVDSTPDDLAPNAGAAYVFVRSNGLWQQQAYLKASNPGEDDIFGSAVAISGDIIVIGAREEDGSASGVNSTPDDDARSAGAAYVFRRSGGVWSQEAYLKPSNMSQDDEFGFSVAASGDVVVVGAPDEDGGAMEVNGPDNDDVPSSGAAYVFRRSNGVWVQEAYLKAENRGAADSFGSSVGISGDLIAVGAPNEGSTGSGINPPFDNGATSGAVYTFVRSNGQWRADAFLKASNPDSPDDFGQAVAVDGDTIVVGAPQEESSSTGVDGEPNNDAFTAGAAYIFSRRNGSWSQEAYLKPFNTSASDFFGRGVAVSGDLVLVGSNGEDSTSTGVNGEDNDDFNGSGAAYVFARGEEGWEQNAYLKASNTGSSDSFGGTVFAEGVGISQGTVVVGAINEDSPSTGVDGDQGNDSSSQNSGAAYVFNDTTRVSINSGLNDAWADPNVDGQGFFLAVFPDLRLMSVAWFTFDLERPEQGVTAVLGGPGQRWLTAIGDWEGNVATLTVERVTGGVFDQSQPPVDREMGYGTITIEFHDCSNATVTYDIPELMLSGSIDIVRLVMDNAMLCETFSGM